MKKLLTILLFLIAFCGKAQDEKPSDGASFKYLQSPFFFYNLPDSSVWVYKGQLYGWTKLDRAKDPWYIKMLMGQDTVVLPIHKKDTLSLPVYKLKGDSLSLRGYVSGYRLKQNLDSLMLLVYSRPYLDSVFSTKQDTLHNPVVQADSTLLFVTPHQLTFKVDKISGKALSDNSLTDADSLALKNLTSNLNSKLDTTKATVIMRRNWDLAFSWGDHSLAGYLTSVSLNGYVTQSAIESQGYLTSSSLADYPTLTWINNQGYVTGAPWTGMGYVTGTPWTAMGYLTAETDPSIYAWAKLPSKPTYSFSEVGAAPASTVSYSDALSRSAISLTTSGTGGASTYNSLTGVLNVPQYIGEIYSLPIASAVTLGGIKIGSGINIDISGTASVSFAGYATQTWVSSQGYVTGTPWTSMGYVTGTPWTGMGYLTSVSLSGYATQSWVSSRGYITGYTETDPTLYSWAKASTKPSYAWSEISGKPTTVSSFTNDAGYITGTPWTSPFTNTGTITAVNFQLSSDRRLKTNIKELTQEDFSAIRKIEFRKFNFKTSSLQRYGVIAQQVEKVMPELVSTGPNGMKSVSYIDLLIAKIAELENRIKAIEDEE